MDLSVFLFVLVAVLILLLLPRPNGVPTATLIDYLPSGPIFNLIQDAGLFSHTLRTLTAKYGDVFRFTLPPSTSMVVTSVPEDIAQILSASADFGSMPGLSVVLREIVPGGLDSMSREVHKRARDVLRGNFNTKLLHSFHGGIMQATDELCESLEGGVKDISELFSVMTFRVLTNVAFGVKMDKKERAEFIRLTRTLADELMAEFIGYPIRQYLTPFGVRKTFFETIAEIRAVCEGFIQRRREESEEERAKRHPDILDTILILPSHNEHMASSLVMEFAMAGAMTSSESLAWAVYEVCRNERVRKKMEAEIESVVGDGAISIEELQKMPYVDKVWRETTRLHTVANSLERVALRDVRLKGSGVEVKRGESIAAFLTGMHTNEMYWDRPLEFRPERWEQRPKAGVYLAFGMGRKSCAGRFLADYQGRLVLAEVFRRFRIELACGEVVGRTCFVEAPKSRRDGVECGVLVRARRRFEVGV